MACASASQGFHLHRQRQECAAHKIGAPVVMRSPGGLGRYLITVRHACLSSRQLDFNMQLNGTVTAICMMQCRATCAFVVWIASSKAQMLSGINSLAEWKNSVRWPMQSALFAETSASDAWRANCLSVRFYFTCNSTTIVVSWFVIICSIRHLGVLMRKRVLFIENEGQRDRLLRRALIDEGYRIDCVSSNSTLQKVASHKHYDLIIPFWQPSSFDGPTICRKLRVQGCTSPILVLSSRTEISKQIQCLEAGADDYLTKPYNLALLLARIGALIRRGGSSCVTARVGPLMLDRLDRCAKLEGRPVTLSPREYSVLDYLVRESGRTVPRAELLNKAWHIADNAGSNVVDVHVKKLRKKLRKHATLIETVRGVGYRINSGGSNLVN